VSSSPDVKKPEPPKGQKPEPPKGWPGGVRAAGRRPDPDAPPIDGGAAWEGLLETLHRAGELVLADGPANTPLDRAEGYRHLASLLRGGIGEMLVDLDTDRPRFHWSDGTTKWGLDCADALYAQAPLRGGAVYRVRGNRGSVHFLGLQLVARMRAVHDLDADQLVREPDGSFELVIGGDERPGNWLSLPDDANTLTVRQFFYDWDTEIPASFEIERIDEGARRASSVPGPDGVAAQLAALGRFVHDNTEWWDEVARSKLAESPNGFPDDAGGLGVVASASQKYQSFGIGAFQLTPDEALLIEVEPPKAKYWSLHLGNYWMESLDFTNHQSSLNGHQARLDGDGVFRAVVSLRDPGVPNWLDPAGHLTGSMIYRWNQADGSPIPASRVVPFERLRDELPPDTPGVSAEERAAAVERRRDHVRRRYGRSH
jgi:hypothetical protein